MVAPEWMPVLDLLVRDVSNPRSVAFQVRGLLDFARRIEAEHGPFGSHLLAREAEVLARLTADDLSPENPRLLELLASLERGAYSLSDDITPPLLHARPTAQPAASCCMMARVADVDDPTMPRYRIEHETRYEYEAPVSQSWQLARLTPRELPWQRLLWHRLLIDPAPDEAETRTDSFGNAVNRFALHRGA